MEIDRCHSSSIFLGCYGTELLSRSKEDKSSMEGKSAMIQLVLERLVPSNKLPTKMSALFVQLCLDLV